MISNPKVIAGKAGISSAQESEIMDTPRQLAELKRQGEEKRSQAVRSTVDRLMPSNEISQSQMPKSTPEEDQALNEYTNHLNGLQEAHAHLKATQPEDEGSSDLDSEPHGFDASDKIGMLGAAMIGGGAGVVEMAARAAQIASTAGEKLHLAKAGTGDDFTQWFNRKESRNKLLNEAMQSHPVMTEIGNIVGGALATTGLIAGAVAALPEAAAGTAVAGTAAGVAATAAKAAKIASALQKVMPIGAAKAIINAKRVGAALKLAKVAGKGAMIGETQYDPENNHYISQAMLGTIINIGFNKSGDLIKRLATPLGAEIKNLSEKYGISLPIYPKAEQIAKKIFGSNYEKTVKERGEAIAKKGMQIAKGIEAPGKEIVGEKDYNDYFTGELKKTFDDTKKEISTIIKRIDSNLDGKGKVIAPTTSKVAESIIDNENQMPGSIQDKFLLGISDDLRSGKEPMDYSRFSDTVKRVRAKMQMEKDPDVKMKLADLHHAMLEDQESHIMEHGGKETLDDFHSYKKLYMEKQLPFINGKFQAYRGDMVNSDNFIGAFFKPDSPMKVSEMLNLLPDKRKGLYAARAAIMNQAMHESEIPGVGINTMKFINSVTRLGKTNKVIFEKEQMKTLYGYQRFVKMVSNISKEALDPNVVKFGMPKTTATIEHLAKVGALGAGGVYGGHMLGLTNPMLTMIALAPMAFAKVVTSKSGRALMNKVHSMSENYTQKELDGVTDGFLKTLFKKTAKVATIQTGTVVGRNL